MRNDGFDEAGMVVGIFVGIGIAIFIAVAVAILYYILLLLILEYRYRQYRLQAYKKAQAVLLEHGSVPAEDVARIWFGEKPQGTRRHHVGELLFGVEVRR